MYKRLDVYEAYLIINNSIIFCNFSFFSFLFFFSLFLSWIAHFFVLIDHKIYRGLLLGTCSIEVIFSAFFLSVCSIFYLCLYANENKSNWNKLQAIISVLMQRFRCTIWMCLCFIIWLGTNIFSSLNLNEWMNEEILIVNNNIIFSKLLKWIWINTL